MTSADTATVTTYPCSGLFCFIGATPATAGYERRYAITPGGERLLDHWAEALRRSQERTARFLARYEERR